MSVRQRKATEAGEAAKKRLKREERAEFSAALREKKLKERAAAAWARKEALRDEAVVLDPAPFPHCVIPNFIQTEGFLEGLQKELLSLDFHEKCNDLYKFKQSDDLKKRREPHIAALRRVLFEDFRAWLSDVTRVELEPTVDLSCAKYQYTDALLCHDDELEGRRIAFILYLVPPWKDSDGGTLDLFSTDEHSQPLQVVKSLVPSWNSLAFFEVSPVSFHQARRLFVLTVFLKHSRFLSIKVLVVSRHYAKAEEESLPAVLKSGMELFRSEALFLLLSNFTGLKLHFLAPEDEAEGEEEGRATVGSSSKSTEGQCSRGKSDSSDNTEDSKEIPENGNGGQETGSSVPLCAGELRRWTQGCYSLAHDTEATEFALDLLFFCGCQDWDAEFGGFTSYIAKGEDEELLTVNPEDNCLALIYRDRETLKFVKYINHQSLSQAATQPEHIGFWDFSFVYYE
nr:prolyl 3-hydroxylase OGFOD1 [Anolis sagrei ordinatus]